MDGPTKTAQRSGPPNGEREGEPERCSLICKALSDVIHDPTGRNPKWSPGVVNNSTDAALRSGPANKKGEASTGLAATNRSGRPKATLRTDVLSVAKPFFWDGSTRKVSGGMVTTPSR